jgi:hypothetical protein
MTCDVKLYRKRQIFGKLEAQCGVAEVPTATDGVIRVGVAPSVSFEVEMNKRDIARSTLTKLPAVAGEKKASFKFVTEVVGSGSVSVPPEVDNYLKASGMRRRVVYALPIPANVGAEFIVGETITGGTSGATGRILKVVNAGDTRILIDVGTSVFSSGEVVTGSVSADVATLSGAPVASGFIYLPSTDDRQTITMRSEEDGYQKSVFACAGSFELAIESSKIGQYTFDFSGVALSYGDQAMTTGVVFPTTVPPVLQSAELAFEKGTAQEFAPVFRKVSLSSGNEVVVRKDGNKANGLISALITDRNPQMTIDPEMMSASSYDIFDKLFDCTPTSISFKIGSEVGNTVLINVHKAQYETVGDADADSVASTDCTLSIVNEGNDNEYEIIYI